jgi:hypothetical protein
MNTWKQWGPWIFVVAAAVCCAGAWYCVLSTEYGGCEKGEIGDALQKAIATLDATIELGLKLSVSLVAAGAALLVGLKSGVRMTAWGRALLLVTIFLFGQSALSGVLWKLEIANAWFNKCLPLVGDPKVQAIFNGSFGFFIAGLLGALGLVAVAALSPERGEQK